MEKALVWSFFGHYKNTLHSKNISCCRTETRTDDDGKSHSETVTDYYRNHEAYTKQEVVVHNGPALPPVLSTSPHDMWIVAFNLLIVRSLTLTVTVPGCPLLPLQLPAAAQPPILLRDGHRQREVGRGLGARDTKTTLLAQVLHQGGHREGLEVEPQGEAAHHDQRHPGPQPVPFSQARRYQESYKMSNNRGVNDISRHILSCVQETVGTTSGCAASAASLGPSLQLSTLTGR